MLKDRALREEIKRFTPRQISPRALHIINHELSKLLRNRLKEIVTKAIELQEARNEGRSPPISRLNYKIIEEVTNYNEVVTKENTSDS